MAPKFLGGEVPDVQGKDRRAVLAEWLTSPDNPFFATNVANRVWAHFFGLGIVEPVDDIRVSNPPSNPELFEELGEQAGRVQVRLQATGPRHLQLAGLSAQLDSQREQRADERNFAHANVRRIPAEVLLDCISQVTETKDKFRGLPLGARAVQIADGRTSTTS